jgi:predicted nucleotidyltransferase component of viral defense system
LLSSGNDSESELKQTIKEILAVKVTDDAIIFHPETITIADIREESEYEGKRVKFQATIGKARIMVQVDIAFGDAVFPAPKQINYPTLLTFPEPHIRAYPLEAIIAEKLQTMVYLGIINSRMKDIYDIYMLIESFDFSGQVVSRSIKETFKRRKTTIPVDTPVFFSEEFTHDTMKQNQWDGFISKSGLAFPGDLTFVMAEIGSFIRPILVNLYNDKPFTSCWRAGGPWF